MHLKNIYKDGELGVEATTEFFSVVQNEGGRNVWGEIVDEYFIGYTYF